MLIAHEMRQQIGKSRASGEATWFRSELEVDPRHIGKISVPSWKKSRLASNLAHYRRATGRGSLRSNEFMLTLERTSLSRWRVVCSPSTSNTSWRFVMNCGPSRSIIRGAVLILAAAVAGCGGQEDASTVGEVLVEPSGAVPITQSDRAAPGEPTAAVEVVSNWAREDGMVEESLRALLDDLAERASLGSDDDDITDGAWERGGTGSQDEPSAGPF